LLLPEIRCYVLFGLPLLPFNQEIYGNLVLTVVVAGLPFSSTPTF